MCRRQAWLGQRGTSLLSTERWNGMHVVRVSFGTWTTRPAKTRAANPSHTRKRMYLMEDCLLVGALCGLQRSSGLLEQRAPLLQSFAGCPERLSQGSKVGEQQRPSLTHPQTHQLQSHRQIGLLRDRSDNSVLPCSLNGCRPPARGLTIAH